jgi:hypothetical protein
VKTKKRDKAIQDRRHNHDLKVQPYSLRCYGCNPIQKDWKW